MLILDTIPGPETLDPKVRKDEHLSKTILNSHTKQ